MLCSSQFWLLWVTGCMVTIATVAAQANQRPHILFILADDLGWNDVSFHGSQQIPTPNLDTLAYDGIILNNYYVQPICTPTRSALMTGRHPIHLGLQHGVITGSSPYGLGLDQTIMPEYLKTLGYHTHIIGKWHLGFYNRESTPTQRGFDTHKGYYQGCGGYWDHTYVFGGLDKDRWGLDFHRQMELVKTDFGRYSTELFTEEAEKIIQQHDPSQPMYMYMAHQAVHSANPVTPLEAPWKYIEKFGHIKDVHRRKFAAMVSVLDDSVGNVTKALAARGMLNNTIIVFSTDNGGPAHGYDANYANNWPLRGMKHTVWEGGVRGDGFIWSPHLKKSGYVSHHMMQVFDWLPTLLHAAGYDTSKLPRNLDGLDQWDALSENKDSVRREMLHNIDGKLQSLRVHDMKIVIGEAEEPGWYPPENFSMNGEDLYNQIAPSHLYRSDLPELLQSLGRKPQKGSPVSVKCGPMPANATTACKSKNAACLFNITNDPCEYFNLADQYPSIVQSLTDRLGYYEKTAVPPRNKPDDPAGYPINNGLAWQPWLNLTESDLEELARKPKL